MNGSFGSSIGGSDPIAAAMQRRGMGVGVTQQVSPASANFDPGAVPTGMDKGQVQPAGSPAGVTSPPTSTSPAGSPGLPPGSFESQIIIKALDSRLKTLSKIEENKSMPSQPQGIGGL